jgi:hypothetical protein
VNEVAKVTGVKKREVNKAELPGKPFWFPPVPAFLMKLLYGEMSSILPEGSRVSSDKIIKAGYVFLFPEIEAALKDLLIKNEFTSAGYYAPSRSGQKYYNPDPVQLSGNSV